MAELVFEDLLVGDVTAVEHQSAHTGLVDEVGDDRLEMAPRTIGMADPPIDHHFARVLGQEVDDAMPPLPIRIMNGIEKVGAQGAFLVPAQNAFDGGTLEQDGGIGVDDGDEVRGVLHQRREAGLSGL